MKKRLAKRILVMGLAFSTIIALAPGAFCSEGAHGGGRGSEEAPAGKVMTPQETVKAAIQGNDQFTGHHDSHYFDAYQTGQTPNLTVVSCSDSRVHTPLFGIEPNNNIFIIRNIGNQVSNSEGSVDYGVHHLPCKILLIMGHSSCGAVKAAMGDYSGETAGIKAELDPLKPVIMADDHQGDFNIRWAKNVERNVDYQVQNALKLYDEKVKAGEMTIVGGVYDFNDNYGKGRGTLVITNINGESDPNKIMRDPLLEELSKGEIAHHVGSLAPGL